MTLENYMESIASSTNWPAASWLCVCGTLLHNLSPICPCKQTSRRTVLTQQAIFVLRKAYACTGYQTFSQSLPRPFSLTTLLAVIYHPDNLGHVNEWLLNINTSEEVIQLDHSHLKALSPPVTWICHQLDAEGCQCPSVRLVGNKPPAMLDNVRLPVHSICDSEGSEDDLVIHAPENLMEFSSTDTSLDCAEAITASQYVHSLSPPTLRSTKKSCKEENSQNDTSLTSRLIPAIDGSATKPKFDQNKNSIPCKTSVSNLKDRLGPKLHKNPRFSKQVNDPDAVPSFFKGLFPPNLSPINIRLTQVLPEELTGPDSSVRFMQEMYCIELTQFYKANCPPHLRGIFPYLVPEIFSLMRPDQLVARKNWLMKTFLRKNYLRPQIFVHADRPLSNDEIGTHRIPLQVILSESAPLVYPTLEYFKQISELLRLKNLGKSLSIKRKAEGQLSNPPKKKPTPLMDIAIPTHIKSQSFSSPSAGSSFSRPPPSKTLPQTKRKALLPLPKPVEAITTTQTNVSENDYVEANTTVNEWIQQEATGSGFIPPTPAVSIKTVLLSQEKSQAVDTYCEGDNPCRVITRMRDVTIRLSDLLRLKDNQPLNDRIINFYMMMIEGRSSYTRRGIMVLHTNFYPMLLQGGPIFKEKNAIFQPNIHTILIPIHLFEENHWTLISINMRKRTICHYDSLPTGNRYQVVKNIIDFLKDAHMTCFGNPLNPKQWDNKLPIIPKQKNLVDCGAFVLQIAENISRGAPHTFTPEEIPSIRKRMVLEILNQKILSA